MAWQLRGVETEADGGLVIVPGSHKANMPCPVADPGAVETETIGMIQPRTKAGDVLIFMGAATGHGAWAVGAGRPGRRVALFSYLSAHDAVASGLTPQRAAHEGAKL